ncbi:MAG: Fic family protein [Clostridia bacterium]|nr:Fic family protein [Clostridia bacterium]
MRLIKKNGLFFYLISFRMGLAKLGLNCEVCAVENRAGIFVRQSEGHQTFIPKKLPPEPSLKYDGEMMKLLSDADRKLGRLDGVTQILPNPALFVAMYVRKEALLSSQIEGTQASLIDVLDTEKEDISNEHVVEVTDYVRAMYYGLERLNEFPLSLRLLREIHGVLLARGRGSHRNPGEFRQSQNWIGHAGCTLRNASFVPPAVPDMHQALRDLELFLHEEDEIPVLVKIGLIHAQFETIHPFLDGNGRMGRLLITFWLCQQGILGEPLLYLSYFFKINRSEYYDRLMQVRLKGDWEGWTKFFLTGISEVSDGAISSAKEILTLREKFMEKLLENNAAGHKNSVKLLDSLFDNPVTTKLQTKELLGTSLPTAGSTVDHFVDLGILHDYTPDRQRKKKYIFADYMKILEIGTE